MDRLKLMIAAAGVLAFTTAAPATIINLSDLSSDETDASLLSASMEFTVVGDVLTLTVTNNTVGPNTFDINELYFNAPEGVTLSFDGAPGWSFQTDALAGGFGVFSFGLIDGEGKNESQIVPGETDVFTFQILTGSPGKIDFVSLLSSTPGQDGSAIVAAKFVNGPEDDSAYGAAVPTPGVLALLGAAGLVGGRRRRRR